jgi:uncharacterized membrane protein YeaQ/YmgE (transglycosylase-associated protein family)
MTFSTNALLFTLLVAAVCGVIGRVIGGGTWQSFFLSIPVGFAGALLMVFAARAMHWPDIYVITVDLHPFPIVWTVSGAAVSVALVQLIS